MSLYDGREVTYRSLSDLLQARTLIANAIAAQTMPQRGTGPRHLLASFSD